MKEVLEEEYHFDACPICGSWELEDVDDMIWCNGCGRWVKEEETTNECNRTKSA
jgi:ribosomal protein L37AE/L43A